MTYDGATKELLKLNHKKIHALWKIVKTGNLNGLSGEDKWLAKVMWEHQDKYFNQFEMADLTHDREYDVDSGENPFLHISFHVIVERQLEAKDPIEVYQFYNSMRNKKYPRHDTIHLIAVILTPLMFQVIQERREFDLDNYRVLLRKYKNRKPSKIYESLEKDLDALFQK